MKARGSRAEVMHGTAKRTSGGLMKKDLKYNKQRRIVSRKMSLRAKKEKRLEKAGFKTKKGVFGSFKKGKRVSGRRSRRRSKRRSRRRQRGGTNFIQQVNSGMNKDQRVLQNRQRRDSKARVKQTKIAQRNYAKCRKRLASGVVGECSL